MLKRASMAAVLAVLLTMLAAPAHAGSFTPAPGPTFNSAVGDRATKQAINRKIIRTIASTPRGAKIQIMTWNFQSTGAARALLRAQRRGVQVHLLMARGNVTRFDNTSFRRLSSGLAAGNRGRPQTRQSWARTCLRSCRGRQGAAHAKYFLFSRSGKARDVVMQGSANLTSAAANNQWNDIITTRGQRGPYRYMERIFTQMKRDRPVRPTYSAGTFGGQKLMFMPSVGRRSPDPVMRLLRGVQCRGATNVPGGRTKVRIVPDAVREERGLRLARRVRALWDAGCDVKVGYTLMGRRIGRLLTASGGRGPVPLRHLVQDTNRDGQFDNYFHMKAMTVVGRVGKQRGAYVLLNGSANWSSSAIRSDENLGQYRSKALTLRYQEHIDYWFNNVSSATFSKRSVLGRQALVSGRLSDDGLLFGTGPVNGVDPYANVEKD